MSGNDDEKNSSNRAEALKKIFIDIDLNKDQNLSFDEFHQFLSQKAGKTFNQELLTEIFRTIDRDKNSFLNISEFIQGFTKAETIILNQIKQLKSQIQETSEAYTKTQRNLLEAKVKKMQNIAENNLYVVVKRAEALKAVSVTGNRAPMVCITCEGLETSTSSVQNPTNPE